jgi:hypothetical protein
MKKLILGFSLLAAGTTISFAQCGKKTIFTSSKTEYLDASGTVERVETDKIKIEISKNEISVTGDQPAMRGTIISDTCNWKIPFKEGKTIIKAEITNEEGIKMNVTITIEGKDGKITLIGENEKMPGKLMRIIPDKFEENK